MDFRRPAQLSYLVIFNPTLRPPSPTDDEDDIEQASILLYTARSRAVSRDTMLRQVGLAKALINFSELFTPEAGCDSVHSQKNRLVMFSPEPNFWMHVCINLPAMKRESFRTPKAVPKGKGKEPATSSSTDQLDYVDNSLHDRVIRDDLKAAYEGFRIMHGTFGEILRCEGIRALEDRLEQYFNMWAWQWDLGASDLTLPFGIPIHHRHQNLRACLDDLFGSVPSTSTIFVLQHEPLSVLNLPRSTDPPDLHALIRYILTLSHASIPPSTHAESNTGHTSLTDSSATIIPPALPLSFDPMSRPNGEPQPSSLSPGPVSQLGSTVAAPFTHAGSYLKPTLDVVNPKKWWPGYLTIQKSASQPDLKYLSREAESKFGAASSNDPEYPVSDATSTNVEDTRHSESASSNNIPKDNRDSAKEKPGAAPDLPPLVENGHLDIDREALEDAMIDTTPPRSDMDSDVEVYPPLPLSPPPPPPFTQLPVRMIHALDPLCTETRILLHVSNCGLTFALLLPPGQQECDTDNHLNKLVDDCLRTLRSLLGNSSMTDLLQPVSSTSSKAILFDERTSTMTVVPPTSRPGDELHLFAAYELFQKHPWLQEEISRNNSNQWFASRKSPAGGMAHKLALLKSGNTQASLVDVDSELSTTIRQRAWQ